MIVIILISIFILIYIYVNLISIEPKKKQITSGGAGFSIKLLSLLVNDSISDIKKNNYRQILDELMNQLYIFNESIKIFNDIKDFENTFFHFLTKSIYYDYYKSIMYFLILIINKDYKKLLFYSLKNIYKMPFIIYKICKDSSTKEELLTKIVMADTFLNACQISSIMKVNLETTIRKMRLVRNIPIIDKNTGIKMITRQVKYPMIGSEVCPFINYVNKFEIKNIKLKYSLLIIEKDIVLEYQQYKCNIHESCVLYKNLKNNKIEHLEDCNFWKDDNFWKNMYPEEKEIIKY